MGASFAHRRRRGELEARSHLFAGAIGVFKNPTSHRIVDYSDPTEAAESVLFTDLLLRLVDRIAEETRSKDPALEVILNELQRARGSARADCNPIATQTAETGCNHAGQDGTRTPRTSYDTTLHGIRRDEPGRVRAGLGPGGRKPVGVRVPPSAPLRTKGSRRTCLRAILVGVSESERISLNGRLGCRPDDHRRQLHRGLAVVLDGDV